MSIAVAAAIAGGCAIPKPANPPAASGAVTGTTAATLSPPAPTTTSTPAVATAPADSPASDRPLLPIPGPTLSPLPPPTSLPAAVVGRPVPELPADLGSSATTTASSAASSGDPDDDDGTAAAQHAAADTAAAWVMGRLTRRAGEPGEPLHELVTDPALAHVDEALPPDVVATWPIVTDVTAAADGWWRVDYTLKRLEAGQIGPTSTRASMLVHVTEKLLVSGEAQA